MKKKENYLAPKIELFEVIISGMLCQSGVDDNPGSTSEDVGEEIWTL